MKCITFSGRPTLWLEYVDWLFFWQHKFLTFYQLSKWHKLTMRYKIKSWSILTNKRRPSRPCICPNLGCHNVKRKAQWQLLHENRPGINFIFVLFGVSLFAWTKLLGREALTKEGSMTNYTKLSSSISWCMSRSRSLSLANDKSLLIPSVKKLKKW